MGARASAAVPATPASEWASYVAASGIVDPRSDEAAIHFVADALHGTPLPAPWVIGSDEQGQRSFINVRTGESTWRHPLEDPAKALADIFNASALLSQEHRDAMLCEIHQNWATEAKLAYRKWRPVRMDDGGVYHFNTTTHETMWEHPAEVVMPGHYMRVRAIERLRSKSYLDRLHSRACIAYPDCSLERGTDDVEFEPAEWRLTLDPHEAHWVDCA
mmetsp:Transcript_12817/g.36115  ORF Transcript_12817/g.36115 Transcript_12817/m.36115 type:complete len:217 (+) Transcript_12817:99-749(+)